MSPAVLVAYEQLCHCAVTVEIGGPAIVDALTSREKADLTMFAASTYNDIHNDHVTKMKEFKALELTVKKIEKGVDRRGVPHAPHGRAARRRCRLQTCQTAHVAQAVVPGQMFERALRAAASARRERGGHDARGAR